MFVHKMDGSWLDHPFWKSNFLIEDHKRLQTLKSSKLRGVVIDTSKGKDTGKGKDAGAPAPQARAAASETPATPRDRIRSISNRSKREAQASMPTAMSTSRGARPTSSSPPSVATSAPNGSKPGCDRPRR